MSPLARILSTWGRIPSPAGRVTSQFFPCDAAQTLIQTGFPAGGTAFTKGFTNGSINCLTKDRLREVAPKQQKSPQPLMQSAKSRT